MFGLYDLMLNQMHIAYATETKLGTDTQKQEEWEKKIREELKK